MRQLFLQHIAFVPLLARVILGILFFFQGFDAVFNIKIKNVAEAFYQPLQEKKIPKFLILIGAYFTSYVELIFGLFLIFGFLKYFSLYFLGIDLIFASLAFSLAQPMWDMRHVFPRLALILFLLLLPSYFDALSVDVFFKF